MHGRDPNHRMGDPQWLVWYPAVGMWPEAKSVCGEPQQWTNLDRDQRPAAGEIRSVVEIETSFELRLSPSMFYTEKWQQLGRQKIVAVGSWTTSCKLSPIIGFLAFGVGSLKVLDVVARASVSQLLLIIRYQFRLTLKTRGNQMRMGLNIRLCPIRSRKTAGNTERR